MSRPTVEQEVTWGQVREEANSFCSSGTWCGTWSPLGDKPVAPCLNHRNIISVAIRLLYFVYGKPLMAMLSLGIGVR